MPASQTNRMPVAGTITDLSPAQFGQWLNASGQPPLLLDVWAPWCQPCRAQAPALQHLAVMTAGRLRVARLDTQTHPELARKLGVRTIPLLVLFRGGRELARLTGLQTSDGLRAWVEEQLEARVAGGRMAASYTSAPLGGAFYGDDALRRFLLDRVIAFSEQGRIEESRFPSWWEDGGTPSCALVHHESTQVFARVTGMSEALAFCLHFVGLRDAAAWHEIFHAIPAGADTRAVAPRLLLRWLGDEQVDWAAHLGRGANAVRLQWLALCTEWLHGEPPLPEAWQAMTAKALALSRLDPERLVQEHFAQLLSRVSPPPSDDSPVWAGVLCMYGTYLLLSLVARDMGASDAELGYERVIHLWFSSRCPDPAAMTINQLEELHARFEMEQGEALRAHEARMRRFGDELGARLMPKQARLRAHLVDALNDVQYLEQEILQDV